MYPQTRSARGGFTLVELLVVIAIIALLIAILLPSLAKARRQARSATCLSNLRQFGMSFLMYTDTNRGLSFVYNSWESYGGDQGWLENLRPFYAKVDAVRFCPEATDPSVGYYQDYGDAFHTYMPYVGIPSSYGINGWWYRQLPVTTTSTQNLLIYSGVTSAQYERMQPRRGMRDATIVPLIGDSNKIDSWPRRDDPTPSEGHYTTLTGDRAGGTTPYMLGRFALARHGLAVNIVFLDGHAATVPLAELWRLKWHEGFEPRDVLIR
jgi:prepilin-type N-terminal cleavage/methylation domain-containing protein/prepilin-type processing-associated H-X9-DG protein